MDADVIFFVENKFTRELQKAIIDCFEVFDRLDFQDYIDVFIDIVNSEHLFDHEALTDIFLKQLNSKLDEVLAHFYIFLSGDTSTINKVKIVDALSRLTSLEDYSVISAICHTYDPNELKLANVLAELTGLDVIVLMDMIVKVEDVTLTRLRQFVYSQEEKVVLENYPEGYDHAYAIECVRLFTKAFSDGYVGIQIAKSGTIGEDFDLYLPYIREAFDDITEPVFGQQFLSLCYICNDTYKDPVATWRNKNEMFGFDLSKNARIEQEILNAIGLIEEQRRIQNEQK